MYSEEVLQARAQDTVAGLVGAFEDVVRRELISAEVWFHCIHGLVYSASVPSAPCPISPFARTELWRPAFRRCFSTSVRRCQTEESRSLGSVRAIPHLL